MKPICEPQRNNYSIYISAEAFAYPNPETAAQQTIKSFRVF